MKHHAGIDHWANDVDASTTASSTHAFSRGFASSRLSTQSQSCSSHAQDLSLEDVDELDTPETGVLLENLMRDLNAQRHKLDGMDAELSQVTSNTSLFDTDITQKAKATELRRPQFTVSTHDGVPSSSFMQPSPKCNNKVGGRCDGLSPHSQTSSAAKEGPWWELQMQLGSMAECVEDLDKSAGLYFPRDEAAPSQRHLPTIQDESLCTRAAWGDPRLLHVEPSPNYGSDTPRAAWGVEQPQTQLLDSDDEFQELRSGKSWLCGFGRLWRKRSVKSREETKHECGIGVVPSQPSSLTSHSPQLRRKSVGDVGIEGIQHLMQEFMQQQQEQSADLRKQLSAVQTSGLEMRSEMREQVKLCHAIQARQQELQGDVGRLDDEVKSQTSFVRAPSRVSNAALNASAMGSAMGALDAASLLHSTTAPIADPLPPPPVPPPGTVVPS